MRIEIVGHDEAHNGSQFLISYLCDQRVAIDAGGIGELAPLSRQFQIEDVFLTHAHLDHTATLPVFLDNVFNPGPECVRLHGLRATLQVLQQDMFNNRLWPDFIALSTPQNRFLETHELEPERTVSAGHLKLTPVLLRHVIPTVGYLVSDERSTVAFISDTLPTDRIWELARDCPNLKAVFLEVSFPNAMTWLAEAAAHLTPDTFRTELAKLGRDVPVVAIHLKPRFRSELEREIHALQLPQIQIGRAGEVFEF